MANDLTIKNTQQLSAYFVTELDNSMTLPEGTDKQRLVLNFISLLQDKPELMAFDKPVLATTLVRMAQDNLDALNGEVYLYKGYGGNLTYTISYKGLKKMAMEKSIKPIDQIISKVVYEGDTLEEEIVNGEAHLIYKSSLINKKNAIGVFALVKFKDGTEQYEILTKEDTDKIKAKSKNSGAWRDFELEMMRKAAIRRLCKNITLDFSDKQQADAFIGADELINDPKEQAEKDISENANQQNLDDEVVVEVEVGEDGQTSFVTEE